MTDLENPISSEVNSIRHSNEDGQLEKGGETDENAVYSTTSLPYVVKKPHANSKLILQNMEEVLNSVKRKHKAKHRRKKEQKKLAQEAQDSKLQLEVEVVEDGKEEREVKKEANANIVKTVRGKKPNKSRPKHTKNGKQRNHKTASQENGLNVDLKNNSKDYKSPLKAMPMCNNSSILNHFSRTPKTHEEEPLVAIEAAESLNNLCKMAPPEKLSSNNTPANAFEIMMNARNKSIGGGASTPHKEISHSLPDVEEETAATTKVKRKLVLQEWAEKKGGGKRKLEDEARAAYVEIQLENRAKRFKKMLLNVTSNNDNCSIVKVNVEPEDIVNDHKTSVTASASAKAGGKLRKSIKSGNSGRRGRLGSTDLKEKTESVPKNPNNTVKNRQRRSTITKRGSADCVIDLEKESSVAATPVETETETEPPLSSELKHTPSGRPKRTCAGKTRFDYYFETSPVKRQKALSQDHQQFKQSKSEQLETISIQSPEIIELDDSCNAAIESQQTPKKLAPLFTRSMPKPSPNPEVLIARREFLMSGVPERVRLEQAKQKQLEQNHQELVEFFPKINHVQQFDPKKLQELERREIKFEIRMKNIAEEYDCAPPTTQRRSGKGKPRSSITNCAPKDFLQTSTPNCSKAAKLLSKNLTLPVLDNKREVVKEWKIEFERFPTYKCYNQMREKYRYFSAIDSAQDTEQVTESLMVTRQTRRSLEAQERKSSMDLEEVKPPLTAPNGELLFTEKYKPMLFEQVLVSLTPVTQLREFLSSWSNGGCVSGRNSQTLEDIMDSAQDSCSNQQPSCNSVVLLGPVSSGKTSAVFALANEMNFNVLEINAGMKRTGKKLIQELQEATQSHQIHKENQKSSQKSMNGFRMKRPASQSLIEGVDGSSSSNDLNQSNRKCLILIEDSDIVFEQTDAGFTDAMYTLAASSKRPVIFMATNPNCPHLQRLMNQNTINFSTPHALNISRYLAVLSLIENCPILLDDLVSLYLFNGKDLRKTLLELQFFIQSGGDQLWQYKSTSSTDPQSSTPFYASPNKRRFSEDPHAAQPDEQLNSNKHAAAKGSKGVIEKLYMHRTLFQYFTTGQNEQSRIPFPVDFRLLYTNLKDLLEIATKLKVAPVIPNTMKRKSRSPKKTWLNSATACSKKKNSVTPLDTLCDFYENISIATLCGARSDASIVGSNSSRSHTQISGNTDGLLPNLTDQIAHTLVEKAIEVNLATPTCAYNLFETAQSTTPLSVHYGGISLQAKSITRLDYEPTLRAICRSEKRRAAQERRSTRFYHYLRNTSANMYSFSSQQYEAACDILQDREPILVAGAEGSAGTVAQQEEITKAARM